MGAITPNPFFQDPEIRSSRGNKKNAKTTAYAVARSKSSILNSTSCEKIYRLIHPNVCRCYTVNTQEAVNVLGEMEANALWKFEYNADKPLLAYTTEYPHVRKKLLTDVLKGLVYLHDNDLAHGSLAHEAIAVAITHEGPSAILTFSEVFKKEDQDLYKRKDLFDWSQLVYQVYMGTENKPSFELPAYIKKYTDACIQSCNALDILMMIEADDSQKEMDVQVTTGLTSTLSGLYSAAKNKYPSTKRPKGLFSNLNEFRRF